MSDANALRAAEKIAKAAVVFDPVRVMEAIRKNPEHTSFIISSLVSGVIENAAEGLVEAGYLPVSDDPDTVERVAKAIWADSLSTGPVPPTDEMWEAVKDRWHNMGGHESMARAAIAALKGENQK